MNNISEYSIINTKEIEKEIERLENKVVYTHDQEIYENSFIKFLKRILNNSIPLEGVVKNAFFEGECYGIGVDDSINKEDYIKNLTIKK